MIKINKIYTKTGDGGTTGLVDGPRRQKDDLRIEAYGTVEEANATVGLARLHSRDMARADHTLARIQNDLFDLGSDLATPGPDEGRKYKALRTTAKQVEWLENQIDIYNEALEPLRSFILPGGTPLSAALHLARTVTRRAERIAVALKRAEPEVNPEVLRYLNRLSDLLFVLSRVANGNGSKDVLWEPGRHTGETKSG
ncbi:cob(I)yrinic acid a,c-diamide adenosyltransferase [Pelagibacterium sediminicola]|uniref:cob(I)yrinic acid a,c-diamide adenosyltransferase n=1 Tax=Pelagibacterium sediminicola TaxID=2248761 RepID=UPI000E3113B7|nr:cob(I)yrinic acid a,c-diamide adenosyltransferase [Pelagibacterium sediminicola]